MIKERMTMKAKTFFMPVPSPYQVHRWKRTKRLSRGVSDVLLLEPLTFDPILPSRMRYKKRRKVLERDRFNAQIRKDVRIILSCIALEMIYLS